MKIIVAKTAGFCMGVKRAVDLALENSSGSSKEIKTLGPLIHNSQTIEMLRQRGVTALEENQEPGEKSKLLIRAHGVPRNPVRYEKVGHTIIDGTCQK